MVKRDTADFMAFGLMILSIYLFINSINDPTIGKIFGIFASVIIFISESVFLIQRWSR